MKKLLAAIALLCACAKEAPPPSPATKTADDGNLTVDDMMRHRAPSDAEERANLLNMARGASVVSRTAEAMLSNSAVMAIDGDVQTYWSSPPADPVQSLTFSLPSRSRLRQVGAKAAAAKNMTFESSLDGVTFSPLARVTMKPDGALQLFDVPPTEAAYLRVNVLDATGRYVQLAGVHARGEALAPAAQPSIEGCWSINGLQAVFTKNGGAIGDLVLDGGTDGSLFRFVWTRGPQFGVAAITLTPDGKHLTGIKWHEEPIVMFLGDTWLGERTACAQRAAGGATAQYLKLRGFVPLFGLRFDGDQLIGSEETLDFIAKSGRVRLVSRFFDEPTPERNRARAQARLDSLRAALEKRGVVAEYAVAGDEKPREKPLTELMRKLSGVIELESAR